MKFCAGWFDGEIWLNPAQDGTSFGVYEISAKNNNVPTKSRMRAKTSLQALCLSVRATASDSNSMPASFNLVVAALASALPLALARARNLDRDHICDFNGAPSPRRASCTRALPPRFRLAGHERRCLLCHGS